MQINSILCRRVIALAFVVSTMLISMAEGKANSDTPKPRPADKSLSIKPADVNNPYGNILSRPNSRPDTLYRAVLFDSLESLMKEAEAIERKVKEAKLSTEQDSIEQSEATSVNTIKRPEKRPLIVHAFNSNEPLNAKDSRTYARIFEIQKSGQWKDADNLISRLENTKLMGHVLYQRYMHPTKYRSSFSELRNWLARFSDHPGANDIFRLAVARTPDGFNGSLQKPKRVKSMRGSLEHQITDQAENSSRLSSKNRNVRALAKSVSRHISKGGPTAALNKLQTSPSAKHMNALQTDILKARIAASYLYEGKVQNASQLSKDVWKRQQNSVPLAGWVAGLTSWMNKDFIQASQYFSETANSSYANGWLQSASAYWAARSYKQLRNSTNHQKWLMKAAAHPRTFYGLIALRALGKDATKQFNWNAPQYSDTHKSILQKIDSTNRAMDLIASKQYHLAELEFRRVYPGANPQLREAMLAYALDNGLASFALRFGNTYKSKDGALYDAALYPVGGWTPKTGYQMDKALVHAFIRQESEFNPTAENPSGATGLMQLMPRTASYVAGDKNYGGKLGRYLLKDPSENLEIGQKYIRQLMNQSAVSRDLFSLAMAYNAGPGNLRKWKREYADIKDPLLFIELIPLSETRSFVERVMRNLWIYRQRMNQPTPSLDQIASGEWARYVQLDSDLPFDVALSE